MNEFETKVDSFLEEALLLEAQSDAIHTVLAVVPFLSLVDEGLLDFLAAEVAREQIARASSEKEAG